MGSMMIMAPWMVPRTVAPMPTPIVVVSSYEEAYRWSVVLCGWVGSAIDIVTNSVH